MALQVTFKVCVENCDKFTITETTGLYNVSTNATGWGAPNDTTGDQTLAELEIIDPTGDSTTFDVDSSIPVTPSGEEWELYEYGTLSGEDVIDGLWKFIYTVEAPGVGQTRYEVQQYNICSVRCCIDKQWANIAGKIEADVESCNCMLDQMDNAILSESLLFALKSAVACGDTSTADDILARLQKICALEKCKCSS